MKKNKFVFPILLTLLIIFLPATIYGVNKHNSLILDRDNPEHLPKKNNKLYFYDKNDTLLGIYECKDKTICDVATSTIDDTKNLHYEAEPQQLPVYNNEYVFIQDANKIIYYSITTKQELMTLNIVKDYSIGLQGGYVIFQNEFLNYGLLDPASGSIIIEPTYTYMGITDGNYTEDGKLSISKIIVQKDNNYYLIDDKENVISAKISDPIYSFDNNNIYMRTDLGNISILDYDGEKLLLEDFRSINLFENCNAVITTDYRVRVYNKTYEILYFDEQYDTTNLSFEENGDVLTIVNKDDETRVRVSLTENNNNNKLF